MYILLSVATDFTFFMCLFSEFNVIKFSLLAIMDHSHPVRISVESDQCDKPVNSASHGWEWGHLLASDHTISCKKFINIIYPC